MNNANWIDVAALADVPEEDVIGVDANGHDIALYRIDGKVFATHNLCTHGLAKLCDGFLEGHEIECPLHQGRFDVRSGAPICEPITEAVATYPVKIENDRVFVALT